VSGTVAPGAFPIQLSLTLLAGVVIGGLGSLMGAVWGAALLVLLPNWTNDLASSFSLSTNVAHNLPLAIYGVVLIGAMLAWPSGIQGGLRAIGRWAGPTIATSFGRGRAKTTTVVGGEPSAEAPAASVAAPPAPEAGAKTPSEG
jgi:branched-chain amino acid transport system permease protein